MKKIAVLIVVLALAISACGGGDGTSTVDLPTSTGDEPALDSTCLVGEPDCSDIPGDGGEPQDLPGGDEDGDTASMVAIADAAGATGQIIVSGYVVDVAGEIHLCEALAESYPPQCGGNSITVTDLSQIDPDSFESQGDVSWTNEPVLISGEIVDGTLVANPRG